MKRRKPFPLLALPDGVRLDEILFVPDFDELRWNSLMRVKAEMNAQWLHEQTCRLAGIAQEIDEAKRNIALADELEKQDAWIRADRQDTARIIAEMSKAWDAARLKQMQERAAKAGREIARARLWEERQHFKQRGILRGTR